jgi:DNA-binding MarR family transcriptional regulator
MTPATPALDFCLRLSRAHASLQRMLDDALGTLHGMGHADFIVLDALARAQGQRLPVAALGAPLGVVPSAVVRRLLPLEKTGHIAREEGAVVLRAAGRAAVNEARVTADAICAEALAGIGPGARDAVLAVIDPLAASPALMPR